MLGLVVVYVSGHGAGGARRALLNRRYHNTRHCILYVVQLVSGLQNDRIAYD